MMKGQGDFPRGVLGVLFVLVASGLTAIGSNAEQSSSLQSFDGVTAGFIENRGQVNEAVLYYAPGARVTMYFTAEAVVFDLRKEVREEDMNRVHDRRDPLVDLGVLEPRSRRGCAVWLRFAGANPSPVIESRSELVTRYNYFLGNDPDSWQTNVPAFAELVYREMWPGIDLVFRNEGGRIAYDVILSPGTDPGRMCFHYEGADRVTAREDGSLRVETSVGSFIDLRPVPGSEAGAFLWRQPEQDGPTHGRDNPEVLLWSTFLGGTSSDAGRAIALDPAGNPVVTGATGSSDFPTTPGAYDQSHNGGGDAFVAKLDASGSTLLWSTFLGGSGDETARGLALDPSGNPVVVGRTESGDFPTTLGAYDESHNGGRDVFVAKLDASGSALLWSTFLGGSDSDDVSYWGIPLTLDSSENPLVTGYTRSVNFPTTSGAYDELHNGSWDAFVAKLNASGSALLWSTFLGGGDWDEAFGVALDPSENPVLTGGTGSPDFPTTPGAYDESHNGEGDVFVTKLDASGSSLLWSTFLGGSNSDRGYTPALGPSGNPVLSGHTGSPDFPTTLGAYDESHNGGIDGFIAKLDASGSTLLWSTYLGGDGSDYAETLVLDPYENPLVTGYTGSVNFPTTPGAYDQSYNNNVDGIVAMLDASGSTLLWSTFLGGSSVDVINGVALDLAGNPVVTGGTESSNFPTTPGAYDQSHNSPYVDDVFVAKLDLSGAAGIEDREGFFIATLGKNYPNPFGRGTTIEFDLPGRGGHVSLAVFDIRGGLVRTLVDRDIATGYHAVYWNGTDDAGAAVSSGMYFYRLSTRQGLKQSKAVRLR